MKKVIFLALVFVAVGLIGCEEKTYTPMVGSMQFKTVCLDGVTYYMTKVGRDAHATGYMSVKLDRNSKVVACDPGVNQSNLVK